MQNNKRQLHLDVCNYQRKKLCPLYDNHSDISGQAYDVFVTTERNGWKELSFSIPSVCVTDNGFEENYRLNFLKADFKIRIIDDDGPDWFIISEPKITHNAYSKTTSITAGHVSQLLKMKNLGLEFSDDAGNNVGTAEELLTTILNGTGWKVGRVYPFAEKDGTPKRRSLKASAKTGAFKLIAMMCELFDAKPVYHGDDQTVDIVPINPFSEPPQGGLPDLSLAREVVELYYGKNISNVARTLNTENMVTKLYAYGAYGDKTSGYCGIDECSHTEYIYVLTSDCTQNFMYNFTIEDAAGVSLTYHFTPTSDISAGSKLIYSLLDPASATYIWDDSNRKAYPVIKGTAGSVLPADVTIDDDVKNWFQFVMDFDYYREVGLLTDDMMQIIADYQRTAPEKYAKISEASMKMSDAQTELSRTIGVIDFCKLDVDREEPLLGNGYTVLVLNKETYSDGVIYRTDYDKNKDNYFEWRVTDALDTDGDPINSAAGIVYVIHDTNPVTWDKAYLKALDDKDNPTALTLWADSGSMRIKDTDQFFLFAYNGINGHLGTLESNDESAVMSLEEAVRVVTVDHPVVFTEDDPITVPCNVNGYGWLWRYKTNKDPSEMYFTFKDEGDIAWNFVYFQDGNPGGAEENSYWYDWRNSILYRRKNSAWVKLDTAAQKKISEVFATVYMFGKARDRYYQGLYENYIYTVPDGQTLKPGNYYIENEYSSYWAFTTTEQLNAGDTLTYNFDNTWVTQVRNGSESQLKPKGYRFDNVNYHPSNVIAGRTLESGSIDSSNGALSDNANSCRMQSCVSVVPATEYAISGLTRDVVVHFYDDKKNWMSSQTTRAGFKTPGGCSFIRLSANCTVSSFTSFKDIVIAAVNADGVIVIEDLNYTLLPHSTAGDIIGLMSCFDKFVELANLTYDQYYTELKAAQKVISDLEQQVTESIGDLYREGWWQDANYVDGDEDKLYADVLDNIKEVSKPEATYNITYLDLYNSNEDDVCYGASDDTVNVMWPDISIEDAVHLCDPEIAINTWAFIDKIQKCYDKRWKTKVVINTKLSTIGQHSFTDVMSNIATVASEMKGKASYYDKTINTSASNSTVNEIVANMNKAERELLTTCSRVDRIGDIVITHSSLIRQTEDEIEAEVKRATDNETYLSSQVKMTAENIQSVVTQDTEDSENNIYKGSKLQTSIDQTAKDITSIVQMTTDDDASFQGSKLQQTLDSFSVEITGKNPDGTNAESSLYMTAHGLSARVEELENSSSVEVTPEMIRAVVRGDEEYGGNEGNEFNTSSVSISKDGVAISTSGTFSVAAGDDDESSAVTINKDGVAVGSTGKFTVDTDNFMVNQEGKLTANGAVINGQISNNGYPVMSRNYDIYIGSSDPPSSLLHTGMIWIKPGAPSSGGSSSGGSGTVTIPTNQTVTFTGSTDLNTRHWFYEEGSANVYLSADTYSSGAKSSYTYEVTIPIYLSKRSDGRKHGAKFKVLLNGSVSVSTTETWSGSTEGSVSVTMSGTSSTWLGDLTSITATVSISRESTASYTGNIYLDRNKNVVAKCY